MNILKSIKNLFKHKKTCLYCNNKVVKNQAFDNTCGSDKCMSKEYEMERLKEQVNY